MDNILVLDGEEMYKKIATLKQIRVDGDNWQIFYIDEINGEKWVKEYPESEYQGGGTPRLIKISNFPWEDNLTN